ncbi:MAG: hypothetical protein AMJ42_00845 [Deltaproteobacteria bacterium DG_8]|nr:MAG: hypothetical protein AMJ42_00845 [Deltaproteobacteria bacterium DG_8]
MGEVQAEPYTVEKGDNLWKILITNYGIEKRQFYFFCRITKSLNPKLKNAHEIVPNQILLIPFKYITHFKIPKEEFRSVLLNFLSSHYSEIPTEEYSFSKGEHVAQVLRDIYNIPDDVIFNRYLNLVKKLNPDLKDIDLIKPDQKIILPSFASYQIPSEEELMPEELLEEGILTERAPAEEVTTIEEVIDEKETEPVYVDPRFRKIARQIPSDRTLYMNSMASIANVLQGKLNSFGEFTIPLMEEGQITIDTNNFPILQLTDRKKIILDYGGELNSGLIDLLQLELKDFEVVTLREHESMESVLDRVFDRAGYFSVDKSHNPLVIGDKIQFEIAGDWVIYLDELLKDVTVVNLIEKGTEPIDSHLKGYIHTYGVDLVDLYMMGEGEREKIDFPLKAVEHKYHPEDVSVIETSDYAALVDSLLTLLEQNFQKDFKVKLFRGKSKGFDIEVMADRYFKREGKGHIISFHTIPEKLIEVITQQGNLFLSLSPPLEDPSVAIKDVLDFLHIRYDSPLPRFSATSNAVKRVELIIPGILIKQDRATSFLLTSLELESDVYQWLMEKKIKVVRLGV